LGCVALERAERAGRAESAQQHLPTPKVPVLGI
jgi:hypothetical protein